MTSYTYHFTRNNQFISLNKSLKTDILYKKGYIQNRYMDPKDPTINRILEAGLREIYGERFIKTEIRSIMQYPLKEHLYIVTYNLNLTDSYPIVLAKIVVDTTTEELKLYDPGLL